MIQEIWCICPTPEIIPTPVNYARTVLLGSLLACGLLPFPATAQKVYVHYEEKADLSRIKTYQWRSHRLFEKNPDLKQVYSTGIQLVLEAGNTELMKKGLQPVEENPDVYVTFFILAKGVQELKTVDVTAWDGYWWYAAPTWSYTEIEEYVNGMIVMDIIDAKTSKVLWRATCGDKVKDFRKRDKNIDKAIHKAFDQFPPKK